MSPDFTIKTIFESSSHAVIEILVEETKQNNITKKSCWLYLEKASGIISKLSLRSKDSSPTVEERFFEQGYLKFDHTQATFIEKYNSAQRSLKKPETIDSSKGLLKIIGDFLSTERG